jgi:hypothetical protein
MVISTWAHRRLLAGLLLAGICSAGMAVALHPLGCGGQRAVAQPAPSDAGAEPPAGPAPVPSEAGVVTAFVGRMLAERVLAAESALATANRRLAAYLAGREDGSALAGTLSQQALVLAGASAAFSSLPSPRLDGHSTFELTRAVEDLALFGDQLAGLLRETAVVLRTVPILDPNGTLATDPGAYAPGARSALAILRRAEEWLAAIDSATGSHATLPGFAPGAPSLESQLAMP